MPICMAQRVQVGNTNRTTPNLVASGPGNPDGSQSSARATILNSINEHIDFVRVASPNLVAIRQPALVDRDYFVDEAMGIAAARAHSEQPDSEGDTLTRGSHGSFLPV